MMEKEQFYVWVEDDPVDTQISIDDVGEVEEICAEYAIDAFVEDWDYIDGDFPIASNPMDEFIFCAIKKSDFDDHVNDKGIYDGPEELIIKFSVTGEFRAEYYSSRVYPEGYELDSETYGMIETEESFRARLKRGEGPNERKRFP
jgi:hypothetical protein